jgi:hypothetical protein
MLIDIYMTRELNLSHIIILSRSKYFKRVFSPTAIAPYLSVACRIFVGRLVSATAHADVGAGDAEERVHVVSHRSPEGTIACESALTYKRSGHTTSDAVKSNLTIELPTTVRDLQ